MKPKFINFFMEVAKSTSLLSHAQRLKVGAVVVKDRNIIAFGYNGMPAGMDNDCETKVYANEWSIDNVDWQYNKLGLSSDGRPYNLKTRPEVIHAEANAITKLARTTNSAEGAEMFITHAPCMECSKLMLQAGIRKVYYREQYRDDTGIQLLHKAGIEVEQVEG